jgi:two-component system response regulator AtoC
MPNLEEKRKHSRAQIDWPVAVQTSQGIVTGTAKNISIDGLCMFSGHLFQLGQRYQITIEISTGFSLVVYAERIWSTTLPAEDGGTLHEVGLRFIEIIERDRQVIAEAVADYLSSETDVFIENRGASLSRGELDLGRYRGRILCINTDQTFNFHLHKAFGTSGCEVLRTRTVEDALDKMKTVTFDLIFLGTNLLKKPAIDVIRGIKEVDSEAIIIAVADARQDVALKSIKDKVYDYFLKPFNSNEIRVISKRALEKRLVQSEVVELREKLLDAGPQKLIGHSDSIKAINYLVKKLAPLDCCVLVTGESGTGKELVADLLQYHSKRSDRPFVKINCAGIPEGLLESELFGYEKGAFTGAHKAKPGKFELANHGTILLDEIGDMPFNSQAKLLRAVENRQIERLGGRKPISIDTRIIAATNQNLPELIREKKFRADLFYRLNVTSIHLPPLREKMEDLPILLEHFMRQINLKLGTNFVGINREALELIYSHPWEGNVRELSNALERAAILGTGKILTAKEIQVSFQNLSNASFSENMLPDLGQALNDEKISLSEYLLEIEKNLIINALKNNSFIQAKAAQSLGLSSKNLWKKIQKHSIDVTSMKDQTKIDKIMPVQCSSKGELTRINFT